MKAGLFLFPMVSSRLSKAFYSSRGYSFYTSIHIKNLELERELNLSKIEKIDEALAKIDGMLKEIEKDRLILANKCIFISEKILSCKIQMELLRMYQFETLQSDIQSLPSSSKKQL